MPVVKAEKALVSPSDGEAKATMVVSRGILASLGVLLLAGGLCLLVDLSKIQVSFN